MPPSASWSLEDLRAVVARHWGYHAFRPLQESAMRAVLEGRDSLVVLPTGGGKSLCYQAPAVLRGQVTVVLSPLISLMKDQVDSLRACGVSAAQMDSSQAPEDRRAAERELLRGSLRLLFVSPERLMLPGFQQLLRRAGVSTFAIDEAHCISHWGHDFRPEYRQLSALRELFPECSIHAYTATATERVRRDIAAQLVLRDPEILVGNFDRPNLTYRVLARRNVETQCLEVLDRHPAEAGIIYCLRRRDVDELAEALRGRGRQVLPYHAGLTPEERHAAQEAFAREECDLIVATVAFGMGIDRSNIRFVLHTGMPKSIEHYQQETGRAGRDGLEAECVLLYSGADFITWKSILERSAAEAGADATFLPGALHHLDDMDRYCRGAVCRHRALVEYFGQAYAASTCGACDLCLGDTETVPDADVVSQKILSCVARVHERFGIGHVISILRGEKTERVHSLGHDKLSTFGLLREHGKAELRDWVYQLIGQGVLSQQGAPYPVLKLNPASWEVMRGQRQVRLARTVRRRERARGTATAVSWEGVDDDLFQKLRAERRELAAHRGVPPYVICSDATLRELARRKPTTLTQMREVYGIGDAKLRDFGERFLKIIADGPRAGPRQRAVRPPPSAERRTGPGSTSAVRALFLQGTPLDEVARRTGRDRGRLLNQLLEYIGCENPDSIEPWVPQPVYGRVAAAVRRLGTDRPEPVLIALRGRVSEEAVRLVVAHLAVARSALRREADRLD